MLASGGLVSNAFGSLIACGILDTMDGVLGYSGWRYELSPSKRYNLLDVDL